MIDWIFYDYIEFTLTESEENQQNLTYFFNILHEKLFQVSQGENSCHDLAFDFQSLYQPQSQYSFEELKDIWNNLWQVAIENRLFIEHKEQPRQLQFALLHHKSFEFFENYVEKIEQDEKNLRQTFDYFVQRNTLHTIHSLTEMKKFPDMTEIFTKSLDMGAEIISNLEGMPIGNCFNYWPLYDNKKAIIEVITQFVNDNPKSKQFNQASLDSLWQISQSVLKYRIIHIGLSHFNIKLSPMTYGYQDDCNEVGHNFLHFIQSVNQ